MLSEILLGFYLGIATSFAPCLFPVLPSFLAFLTGGDKDRKRGALTSLAVVSGILSVFLLLGLLLNIFYEVYTDFFNPNYVNFRFVEGVLLIIFGLLYSFNKNLGSGFFSSFSNKAQAVISKIENPWITAYVIGLFFSILAAPCALILFITVFTLIIGAPTLLTKLGIGFAFSVGIGLPFLLMGALVPSLKESLTDSQQKIFKYMPYVTGTVIVLVGIFLMVDAIVLGFDFSF